MIKTLQDQKDTVIGVIDQGGSADNNENLLVAKLIDYDEVDYEAHNELLYSLAAQMMKYLNGLHSKEDDVRNIVVTQAKELAEHIWLQMDEHFECTVGEFETPKVKPFTTIRPHNFSRVRNAEPKDFKVAIKRIGNLKKTLFTGFKKSCHSAYKFDTFGEHRFSQILEADSETDVQKWLRPAPKQFHIYWKHHTRNYEPDFVVETQDTIWIVELKAKADMESSDVQEKKRATLQYCQHASDFNSENGGKNWGYLLIPDEEVSLNKSFAHLADTYKAT